MKKFLLTLLLLSACTSTNSGNNTPETYKPQAVDTQNPIRMYWVRPATGVPGGGSNPNFFVRGWSVWLVNTSDSDFTPYNWRIRTSGGREEIYAVNGNQRNLIPARGAVVMQGTSRFLDTTAGFATLVTSTGTEVQTVNWQQAPYSTTIQAFPKPPNTPFALFRVMPNPIGLDDEKEEIWVQNIADTAVSPTGWKIRSTSGNQEQLFQGAEAIAPQAQRMFQYKIRPWLNNDIDTVQIVNPQGVVVHWIGWRNAKDGNYIYPRP
jgi:hypothetical protein